MWIQVSGNATNQAFEFLWRYDVRRVSKKLVLTLVILVLPLLALARGVRGIDFSTTGTVIFQTSFSFILATGWRFKDIPLNQGGEYHFRFWGLPKEEMSLLLYIRKPHIDTMEDRKRLMNLQATIEATLADAKGNVACHAIGRPADGNSDGIWVLMSGPDEAAFWHYQCNFVQVFPYRSYDLMIKVSDVGRNEGNVEVTPTLKGGGVELP